VSIIKRWLTYLVIFLVAMWVVDQYREYNQLKELEAVRKDLIRQEKEAEKNCLKNALYYEARSEGKLGILAVASVIENRKQHPSYPSSYCGVIQQHKQFSYTMEGRPDVEAIEERLRAFDREAYAQVSEVADRMLEGRFESLLPSNVLWYHTKNIKPYWIKTKQKVINIKNHIFYK
jgi:N-acetylmuramoyl-L-alanine amidase